MKKFNAIILSLLMLVSFAACGGNTQDATTSNISTTNQQATNQSSTGQDSDEQTSTTAAPQNEQVDYESIPDTMTASDGKYLIGFVTDVGVLKDKSFNQGTWEGVKKFAYDEGKSYKYYQPAGGDHATDDDRYNAMKAAADAGAEIIVCAGLMQAPALKRAAKEFADVKFVFIDGWVLNEDENNEGEPLENVASVDFREEQSGYLAGYAAVMEGYTKLGFSGGGGGTTPSCSRFGYGYIQGAEAAAKELDTEVDMKFSWEYGASFSASPELQTMLEGWYSSGTQAVFICGGSMCQSGFAAASANDAAVIGVDVDQSGDSDTVITSATKGLRESVGYVLEKFYSDSWNEIGGKLTTLGAAEDAVSLPTENWRFKKFTTEDYKKLFENLKNGTVEVDRDYETGLDSANFEKVNLTIV